MEHLVAVVAIEEEFLTEVAGIAEACPGIVVEEVWLVVAWLAVAAVVEAWLAPAVVVL